MIGDAFMGATKAVGTAAGMIPVLGVPAQLATQATLSGQRRFFGIFDKKYRRQQQ